MTFSVSTQSKTITIEGTGFLAEIAAFMDDHNFDPAEWRIESKMVQVEIKRIEPSYPTCNQGRAWITDPE